MQRILSTAFFCLVTFILMSCSGLTSRIAPPKNIQQDAATVAGENPGSGTAQGGAAIPADAAAQLIDTTKLKGEMNSLLNAVASGKTDTNLLKATAKDVLNTTDQMLSDSGIDKLYGNSNDPAVKAAAEALKKYRNGMGITPAALDSIKQAAARLNNH
jgi:hypothetical protein